MLHLAKALKIWDVENQISSPRALCPRGNPSQVLLRSYSFLAFVFLFERLESRQLKRALVSELRPAWTMAILDVPCGLQDLRRFHGRGWNLPRHPRHHLCGRNRFTVN